MKFQEYNLTVEYYRVPFLVVVSRPPVNASKQVRGAIRLDKLHWYFTKWVNADVIIFNAGHWWNEDKTINMYDLTNLLFVIYKVQESHTSGFFNHNNFTNH